VRGATALAEALRSNSTLTSINLKGCDVDEPSGLDEGTLNALAAVGQEVAQMKTQASLKVIGEALLSNPSSALTCVECDAFCLLEGITTLRLDKDMLSPGAATLLAAAVRFNPYLVDLSVRHCPVVGTPAKHLADAVLTNSHLLAFNKLPLEQMRSRSPHDSLAAQSVTAAARRKPLTTLKLPSAGIGPPGGIVAACAARACPTLTSLVLPYNRMGVEGGEAMASMLRSQHRLTVLDVRSNGIVGETAAALARAVLASPTLLTFGEIDIRRLRDGADERLELIGLSLGPPEAHVLAGLLAQSTTAPTALTLDRNDLHGEGVVALSVMLCTNTALVDVKLHETRLDYAAVPAIAHMLRVNTTLTELNIGGNKMGKEAGRLLGEALEVNKTLRSLRATAVKFAPEDGLRLKRAASSRASGDAPLEIKIDGRRDSS